MIRLPAFYLSGSEKKSTCCGLQAERAHMRMLPKIRRTVLVMGITWCLLVSAIGCHCSPKHEASKPPALPHNFARWEPEIAAYEKADQANPPPKGAILFIGSSTIRLWSTLAQDFPQHKV